MKTNSKRKQYTIRSVPEQVDLALRRLAKSQGKSVNQIILEALQKIVSSGANEESKSYHDLDSLIGSWVEDPEFDQALKDQKIIDAELWK